MRLPGAVLSVLLSVSAACAGPPAGGPVVPDTTPGRPMASLSPQVEAAAALLEQRLAAVGIGLAQSPVEYRPGEPAALQTAPRAVYRAALTEPEAGWVLIYDLGSADAAARAGDAFAAYLGSGVGQTNYPRDAQFTLTRIGAALVFSWWSRERSSDPSRAEAAFEALRGAGEEIEVRR
jgi:hypothetical protein